MLLVPWTTFWDLRRSSVIFHIPHKMGRLVHSSSVCGEEVRIGYVSGQSNSSEVVPPTVKSRKCIITKLRQHPLDLSSSGHPFLPGSSAHSDLRALQSSPLSTHSWSLIDSSEANSFITTLLSSSSTSQGSLVYEISLLSLTSDYWSHGS